MNSEEIWKQIVGFEGMYEVSNFGNVRALDRVVEYIHPTNGKLVTRSHKAKSVAQSVGRDRYLYVHLHKDNTAKNCVVHRLVAIAFLPNPNNLAEVDHRDFDRSNAALSNLEWVSRKTNRARASDAGRGFPQRLDFERAVEIRADRFLHSMSYAMLAKKYKVQPAVIINVIRGHTYKTADTIVATSG